ncbi:MAG: type II secretion system F family protein [Actinomycetes bacterium]
MIAAVAAVSLSVPLTLWAVLPRRDAARSRALSNLELGMRRQGSVVAEPDERSGALAAVGRRLTPTRSVQRLDRLLARAGRPAGWRLDRLLVGKIVLAVVVAALSFLYAQATRGPLPILVGIAATPIAYFLPELLLHSRAQERSQRIGLELADTLDQMTIAVEAGLGFDAAMARAGKNGRGPLAEELVRTLQDIAVGHSRREAYEALGRRTDVPDLRRFIRAVIQADEYGIAVAEVLRTQANEMRLKRRQRAEEKAMQIPVKVIFPLMLCILPVLFIVLLGPAVLDMMEAFG